MADLQDPFAFVRDEVETSVTNVNALYTRWTELQQQPQDRDELEWTTGELETQLKNIEWDLVDLQDTITAVEDDPQRFKITPTEIESRKAFVSRTKETVQTIRSALSQRSRAQEQKKMRQELKRKNDFAAEVTREEGATIDAGMDAQMVMARRQDAQFDEVLEGVERIGDMALEMNDHLDRQAHDIEAFGTELEETDTRLMDTVNRLERVMRLTSDKKKTIVIMILIVVLIAAIVYYFAG